MNDLIRRARQQNEKIEMLRAKLIRAEQGGLTDRTPEQIREAVKSRLKDGKYTLVITSEADRDRSNLYEEGFTK